MRTIAANLVLLVIVACDRTATSPVPAAPATEPPIARSTRPARELMQDHFTAVALVRDALIVGNLKLAQWNASFLAERELDPTVASWSPHVARLREQASAVVTATSLDSAASASVGLALACGQCHAAHDVTPAFPDPDRRLPASGVRPHMLRHQWAAEQLWNGLVGPSETAWSAGLEELAEAPLGQDEIFMNATATPAVTKLAADVHAITLAAGTLSTWPERGASYARLLGTCAACHAAIPRPRSTVGLGPRR